MKTIIRYSTALLGLMLLLSACSKQKDQLVPLPVNNPIQTINASSLNLRFVDINYDDPNGTVDYPIYGRLAVRILPILAKASITVYNNFDYTSGEIFSTDATGLIVLRQIERGMYSIKVQPYNTNYQPVIIENVIIYPNQLTDLGIVEL